MESRPTSLPDTDLPYCYGWKDSRKVSGKELSQFHLETKDGSPVFSFEIEHRANKGYPRGGFSKWVKQGFPLRDGEVIAVKRSRSGMLQDKALGYAMRSAVFSNVMGEVAVPFVLEKSVYLLMKFHDGSSLSDLYTDRTKQKYLASVEPRLKYVVDILNQLASLHDVDCIHKDIKPGNIMISGGSARLIDLDGAFMEGEAAGLQSFTFTFLNHKNQLLFRLFGTELKNAEMFNKNSDIYALGLTLCVMFYDLFSLTNYPTPEKDWNGLSVITARKTEKARSLHNPLASFILSLIKQDCKYRSAREVLNAFIKLCKDEYNLNFSSNFTTHVSMSKEKVRSALRRVSDVTASFRDEHARYMSSPVYLKHRLCQPKAEIKTEFLFSQEMVSILVEVSPSDYPRLFDNISHATFHLESTVEVINLYKLTLNQLPSSHKATFFCYCLVQLMKMPASRSGDISQFWADTAKEMSESEPLVKSICKLIEIAPQFYSNFIPAIMQQFYSVITRSDDNTRTLFAALPLWMRAKIYKLYHDGQFELSNQSSLIMLSLLDMEQRVDVVVRELNQLEGDKAKTDIILSYLRTDILNIESLLDPSIVSVLATFSDIELRRIVEELCHKLPVRECLDNNVLIFMSALARLNASAAMSIFYHYLLPNALPISRVITLAQFDEIEHALKPRNLDDLHEMIIYFSILGNFAALSRKMLSLPVTSEDRVRFAVAVDAKVRTAFYANYVLSADINQDNVVALVNKLGLEERFSFLLAHADRIRDLFKEMNDDTLSEFHRLTMDLGQLVNAENFCTFVGLLGPDCRFTYILSSIERVDVNFDLSSIRMHLADTELNFLTVRQQIMRKLKSYTAEKLNLHDKRVEHIYSCVEHATSVEALADIISDNSFDSLPAQPYQFLGRLPTHRLFSYGLNNLIKDCKALLAHRSPQLVEDSHTGFQLM